MPGLCGWFSVTNSASIDSTICSKAVAAITRSGESTIQANGLGMWAAAAGMRPAAVYQDERVIAMLYGSMQLADGERRPEAVARHVAQEYAAGSRDFLTRLRGGFCVTVYDLRQRRGLIALDRMGRATLAYGQIDGRLLFATTSLALQPLCARILDVEPQAIANYVYFHMVPGPDTFFRGLRRLEPGEFVEVRDGRVEHGRYWSPSFAEDAPVDFDRAKAQFVSLLESSVRRACADEEVGCFLSGGTDSSTVAGMVGRTSSRPARTYSIGFAAQGYDEMEYARVAVRHFGTRQVEYYVTPEDVVNAVPLIAESYEQPFGNSSAVPAYYCARIAHDEGLRVMLAGDGGDELFGGNQRYADQFVFSLYSRVPVVLRKGLLEPVSALPGASNVLPLRKLGSYIAQASVPMPGRLQAYNAFSRFGPASIFTPDFLAQVDVGQPAELEERTYNGAPAASLINRMLALDWKFTLADNDLRKVSSMCEAAGMDVRYPLLDEELVDFSLQLPPRYKLKGTQLRWFFKRALEDFLPPEIIAKKKQGFGLPFGLWAREHPGLRSLAYDSMTSLKARGIIAPVFIDRMIEAHRNEHAAYYGSLIWVLMMLEQWFQAHVDRQLQAQLPPVFPSRAPKRAVG
ncbi:MAG: asparagine synthase [Burkholderiales bacterium]|nr:asparagine synthase [Burkholderiales bacterium]